MHTMRKGQVIRLDGRDAAGRGRFVEGLFGVAASRRLHGTPACLKVIPATLPLV